MKTLYLVRGLPGSGKSTFVKNFLANTYHRSAHFEADMYFTKDGVYVFDATKLGEAHRICQESTEAAMLDSVPNVFVSNTFTTDKELKPYLQLAEKWGYTVVSLVVENRHGNSSVHGVPEETLSKMENRFSLKLRG